MSTSTQVMELFNIFSKTFGKEDAQIIVKDIEEMIDSEKQKLATKGDLRETELKLTREIEKVRADLTKEIEQVRSGVVKWVAGLLVAQTGVIVTMFMLLK
ncbi:MAG: hypothetical protein AB1847_04315 [bacterium]